MCSLYKSVLLILSQNRYISRILSPCGLIRTRANLYGKNVVFFFCPHWSAFSQHKSAQCNCHFSCLAITDKIFAILSDCSEHDLALK